MKKKTVFVVLYHAERQAYTASSEVIGVYSTKDKAQEAMKAKIQYAYDNGTWEALEENTDRTETDDKITLFDNASCVDFIEVSIHEKEVK